MRTLTLKQLTDADACEEEVELFRAKFGESVAVTEELCRSVAWEFNWNWAARHLLSPTARAAYIAATAPAQGAAWDAYIAATDAAWDAYIAATAPAWDAYSAATAAAWDAYRVSMGAYNAARATAFARAYIEDGEVKP